MRRLWVLGLLVALAACAPANGVQSGKCYRVTDAYSAATRTTQRSYERVPCPEEHGVVPPTPTPDPTAEPLLRPRPTRRPA